MPKIATLRSTTAHARKLIPISLAINSTFWAHHPYEVLAYLGITTIVALLPVIDAALFARLLDSLGGNSRGSSQSFLFLAGFLVAGALSAYLWSARIFFQKRIWHLFNQLYDPLMMKAKASLDLASCEDPGIQNLFLKVNEAGSYRIANFFVRNMDIFQVLLTSTAAAWVMISHKWWVLAVLLLGTIPTLIVEMIYGNTMWGIYGSDAETKRRFFLLRGYFESPNTLAEIKLSSSSEFFLESIKSLFLAFHKKELGSENTKLIQQLLATTILQISLAIIIFSIIRDSINGGTSVGAVTLLVTSMGTLRNAISHLFASIGQQYHDSLFISDILKLLSLKPKLKWKNTAVSIPSTLTPEIVFENVTATYPNSENPILKNLSLTIRAGERVAVVGENGAGKSTLIKMLLRFYDPTEGRILVGGHDIREIGEKQLYDLFAVLPQTFTRFCFPVRQVIALGRSSQPIDDSEVIKAAHTGEAASFIERLPEQYHTQIGKQFSGGIELSGGEAQRLALSTALYRRAKVLILDEPTSAADAKAEEQFFEKLFSSMHGQTLILISHRFSTVRKADRIVVINEGQVAEQGSHEELMQRGGLYFDLFTRQRAGYE